MFVVSLPHILGSCCCTHFVGLQDLRSLCPSFVNWISHSQPLQIRFSAATTVSCAQLLGSHPMSHYLTEYKSRE